MGYRPRVRPLTAARYDLYPPTTTLGWRVVRKVTAAEAADAVALGKWRQVFNDLGDFAGYQIQSNGALELPSGWSICSISEMEVLLNAGAHMKHGMSRTLGMPEEKRVARKNEDGKALPPEDAIERAIRKVQSWPFPASRKDDGRGEPVFGDRAVRAYPRPA